jgi:hypothetical protein
MPEKKRIRNIRNNPKTPNVYTHFSLLRVFRVLILIRTKTRSAFHQIVCGIA